MAENTENKDNKCNKEKVLKNERISAILKYFGFRTRNVLETQTTNCEEYEGKQTVSFS